MKVDKMDDLNVFASYKEVEPSAESNMIAWMPYKRGELLRFPGEK
eukprot:CAMPEP_0185590816 /NCGR_PEP_ID=MMETSP0434-20130131/62170_1 /TAXON_ID=626734 ORGANISM="Favella taraikaensis, Strain Fe Narragansett Bay" /NCGR_SAMPLE_ID=MMETSP0434 /ASSEMBLY_ACC=CAM_ASM_000379 /LENGTH=44 /DNA_ID= /DNA_START= /DNA_END= /DNA_ORIENTATION=